MAPQLSNLKRTIATRITWTVWLEALIAMCLIVLGVAGALLAMQARPYLGEPATVLDPQVVQLLVITSPNSPALAAFIVAVGVGVMGLGWFLARLIHWRFFAPVAGHRVWRQAFFLGLSAMVLAWLKINQALTLPLAVVVILAFALAELYLSLRSTPQSGSKA
jgi:hypothetical protein